MEQPIFMDILSAKIEAEGKGITTMTTVINQTVINLRTQHPEWTLDKIGKTVNRTRERVRQILIKEGLEHRSTKSAYARQPAHLKKGKPCKRCGVPVSYTVRGNSGGYNKYCSDECRPQERIVELTCIYCTKTYSLTGPQAAARQRRVTKGIYQATFCSHSCSTKAYWETTRSQK